MLTTREIARLVKLSDGADELRIITEPWDVASWRLEVFVNDGWYIVVGCVSVWEAIRVAAIWRREATYVKLLAA